MADKSISPKLRDRAAMSVEAQERDVSYAHVPIPSGAQWVSHWELAEDTMLRQFHGPQSGPRGASVKLIGVQFTDGSVENRRVSVNGKELTAKAARKLVADLNAAIAQLES